MLKFIKLTIQSYLFWLTIAGLTWGFIGTPFWVPIRGRWLWSNPYSYHLLSTLLGGSAGFLLGVIIYCIWLPHRIPAKEPLRNTMGWAAIILCVVTLWAQFHLAEEQYGRRYRLAPGFENALYPILEAWQETKSQETNKRTQNMAIHLMQAQTALQDINTQLGEDRINNSIQLGDYLGKIGYDMLNQDMTSSERVSFETFVKKAGPYLNNNVAHGIALTPKNLRTVFNTVISYLPKNR